MYLEAVFFFLNCTKLLYQQDFATVQKHGLCDGPKTYFATVQKRIQIKGTGRIVVPTVAPPLQPACSNRICKKSRDTPKGAGEDAGALHATCKLSHSLRFLYHLIFFSLSLRQWPVDEPSGFRVFGFVGALGVFLQKTKTSLLHLST
jgi:hypothetical protein